MSNKKPHPERCGSRRERDFFRITLRKDNLLLHRNFITTSTLIVYLIVVSTGCDLVDRNNSFFSYNRQYHLKYLCQMFLYYSYKNKFSQVRHGELRNKMLLFIL